MGIKETYNDWLKQKVGEINPSTRYELKISSDTDITITLQLDLVWYILLQVEDADQMKLDVALALLQDSGYQLPFKATQQLPNAKRILAEFILTHYIFLLGLKNYLDFKALNQPVDFISHALLIKFDPSPDDAAIQQKRFMIVELVLNTGFKLDPNSEVRSSPDTVLKILCMDKIANRFKLLQRLLTAGFKLFNLDPIVNNDVAIILLDNRNDPDCVAIVKQHKEQFAALRIRVAGDTNGSNLADYYYWVKEDMATVNFIREIVGIDISS